MLLTDFKGLTEEQLLQLPKEELARIAHEALRKIFQDSTNSSQAPSSDSPEAKAQRQAEQKEKTTAGKHRKQGAQPGHKAVYKPVLELREGDTVVDCAPKICEHCGESLPEPVDSAPVRHQKLDVEIHRRITEYRRHDISCPHCGHVTAGSLPEGVHESGYGDNVVALVGVLTGVCHLSRRMARMLMNSLFDVPMSLGTVSKLEEELTAAAEPVMTAIEKAAQNAPRGNADETGFARKNGKPGWLWVLVTPVAILFRLFANRTQECATRLLGTFAGVLTTDRYNGYNKYSGKRQLCWAHLKRDFKAMSESGTNGKRIGLALLRETRLMFLCWHRFQRWRSHQKNVSITSLESQLAACRRRMSALLEEGAALGVPKCKTILKAEPLLWTFTTEASVEPTNNAAERAIRPAVLWKKRSFGVESDRGAHYVESMLSLWATCRNNGLDTVTYLRELLTAHRSKSRIPDIFFKLHPSKNLTD